MRFLYSIGVYALMAVLLLYFLWRSIQEPEYRQRWRERLGFVPDIEPGALWLHAASVGEVQAITPLVSAILESKPACRLLITSFTPTGSALIQQRITSRWGERVMHCYLPLDTPTAVARFLKSAKPSACMIAETELWPNLLYGCEKYAVPVSVVSATLSDKSLQRYLSFPANRLIPPAVKSITHLLAQTPQDADRFERLGILPEHIQIVGNIKLDYVLPDEVQSEGRALRGKWGGVDRPVWVAASTHEGEEQQVLEAYKSLRRDVHDLLLVLVPRHQQRFERAYRLCKEADLSVVRVSMTDTVDDETEVVLGDTLGQLLKYMAAAEVVFMGGSLVPVGGHNLLEPAALEKCVISGVYTESQAPLRELLKAKEAYIEVCDAQTLAAAVKSLLDSPSLREKAGKAAASVLEENRGVVARILDICCPE